MHKTNDFKPKGNNGIKQQPILLFLSYDPDYL
jgi:hypothetical protein